MNWLSENPKGEKLKKGKNKKKKEVDQSELTWGLTLEDKPLAAPLLPCIVLGVWTRPNFLFLFLGWAENLLGNPRELPGKSLALVCGYSQLVPLAGAILPMYKHEG